MIERKYEITQWFPELLRSLVNAMLADNRWIFANLPGRSGDAEPSFSPQG
jgi:hypothetical protein